MVETRDVAGRPDGTTIAAKFSGARAVSLRGIEVASASPSAILNSTT
jgi:hypothetical protein